MPTPVLQEKPEPPKVPNFMQAPIYEKGHWYLVVPKDDISIFSSLISGDTSHEDNGKDF